PSPRHPGVSFGSAESLSVGVEEEFFIVDRGTLETVPLFSRMTPDAGLRLKPEVFECLVETATRICADAGEALDELRGLRTDLAGQLAELGASALAVGTHAFAEGTGQPIVPLPRYEQMAQELGDTIYRQLVCGLHVHVAMPDTETCL